MSEPEFDYIGALRDSTISDELWDWAEKLGGSVYAAMCNVSDQPSPSDVLEIALVVVRQQFESAPVDPVQRLTPAWEPIETCPKDRPVLLLEPPELTGTLLYGRIVVGIWAPHHLYVAGGYWTEGNFVVGNPTHWMPMPDPPLVRASAPKGDQK